MASAHKLPKYSKHPPRKTAPHLKISELRGPGVTKAVAFFKSCPWDKWWMEFVTEREKSGRMKYMTAFSFCQAKAKNDIERDILYRAIGPAPLKLNDIKQAREHPGRKVPFLGDWQEIRAKAYFHDYQTLDKMKIITREKLDGLAAGRASAEVVLQLITKWKNYDDRIDELFQGTPMLLNKEPQQQEKRAALFFKLKRQVTQQLGTLIDMFLACHGITHNGMNDLGQLVMAVTQAGAKAALTGAAAGALDPSSNAALMLSNAILDKSRIFNMPLPAAVLNGREEEDEQDDGSGEQK